MGRSNSEFKFAAVNQGGTIRVGDLVNNPKFKLIDLDAGRSLEGKLREAKQTSVGSNGDSLFDSIAKYGVRNPIGLQENPDKTISVISGHHRIAVAHAINPDMHIPYINYQPGYFSPGTFRHETAGNCKNCYGDGWDEDEDGNRIQCEDCKGTGVV